VLRKLLHTEDDLAALVVRLVLGIVIFPHGAQKVLGWFGGAGYAGTMQFLTAGLGIPAVLAFLAILAEFAGSLGLLVGFLGRIAAFGIGCNMVVAALLVHRPNGFFMNWTGQQAGEGFEFHLLALAMAIAVVIRGSGAVSIDGALAERM
jgi:putative oxidoreductase